MQHFSQQCCYMKFRLQQGDRRSSLHGSDGIGEGDFVRRKADGDLRSLERSLALYCSIMYTLQYWHDSSKVCHARLERAASAVSSGASSPHTPQPQRDHGTHCSLPTRPRLAQRVVCVLLPSLVVGLWYRVPSVERFVQLEHGEFGRGGNY